MPTIRNLDRIRIKPAGMTLERAMEIAAAVDRAAAGDGLSRQESDNERGVRELHKAGLDDQQAAARIGIRPETVGRIRNRLGLASNSQGGRPKKVAA